MVAKPTAAVEFFRRLLNDTVTADLEIEVAGGAKYLAHRAVLAARSDEIREELSGTVSEARATLTVRFDRGSRRLSFRAWDGSAPSLRGCHQQALPLPPTLDRCVV